MSGVFLPVIQTLFGAKVNISNESDDKIQLDESARAYPPYLTHHEIDAIELVWQQI